MRLGLLVATLSVGAMLATASATRVNGLSLIGLADKAGLPSLVEPHQGSLFLTEAAISLDVQSSWGHVSGWEPWHSVTIIHSARYTFVNRGPGMTFALLLPVATSPSGDEEGIRFRVSGEPVNHSSLEPVRTGGPEPYILMQLYALNVTLPPEGQATVEVHAVQRGAAPPMALYTYYLRNSTGWSSPPENVELVFNLRGGEFVGSTIPPTRKGGGQTVWRVSTQGTADDLVISWKITEVTPPTPEPPIQPTGSPLTMQNLVLIALIVGALIAVFAAALLLRGRSKTKIAESRQ